MEKHWQLLSEKFTNSINESMAHVVVLKPLAKKIVGSN